jgi:hypothetical protein
MDRTLEPGARRLFVSAALTAHAARRLRGRIAAAAGANKLLALARRLGEETEFVERRHRLRFDPPYPGVTPGIESAGASLRLVLACRASDLEGKPLGVVFTTLIPGRSPQVSVAPAEARLPEGWRPPGEPF